MIKAEKIIVCCSKGVTGGPELLHQLVDALRTFGHQAYIAYYPFDQPFRCPEVYEKYNAPQIIFASDPGAFYVVPEAATWILKHIQHTNAAVWWLSVDNFFGTKHQSWLRDLYIKYKTLVRCRMSIYRLRHYKHFVQSKYAEDFLLRNGIQSLPLSDYLGSDHLLLRDLSAPRKDIVVYNPNKGQKQTLKLRQANPDIEFVPIVGMSPKQVVELLNSAKLYIDFGHHPGKDRPPREAAMAGCCVVTGRQGSAKFYDDVPIPDTYKLDDNSEVYVQCFRSLAKSIFTDYPVHTTQFDCYREKTLNEPVIFMQQVESIFGNYHLDTSSGRNHYENG
jgi:hypothetical protein